MINALEGHAIIWAYMLQELEFIFPLAVLIMSVVIHEVSHGSLANLLGDPTARLSGRLTLNPISHLDMFGSIILPFLLFISTQGNYVFGWAKPVPYNPYNLGAGKWGPALVAAAGPFSNFIIAGLFGMLLRFDLAGNFSPLFSYIVMINIVLGLFNILPIPPLDGSKIVGPLLPYHLGRSWQRLERLPFWYTLIFVFLFFSIFSNYFYSFVDIILRLFTGVAL